MKKISLDHVPLWLRIALAAGLAMVVAGKLLGWFTLESTLVDGLVGNLLDDEMGIRESTALGIGVFSAAILMLALGLKKWWLPIIAVLAELFGLIMVYNQLPSSADKELLSIKVGVGYWLSLVGLSLLLISSVVSIVKIRKWAKSSPVDSAPLPAAPVAQTSPPSTPPTIQAPQPTPPDSNDQPQPPVAPQQ